MIQIVIGGLGTVTKGLVQKLEDLEKKRRSGDHPNYCIVNSARILRRVLETCGDLLSHKL